MRPWRSRVGFLVVVMSVAGIARVTDAAAEEAKANEKLPEVSGKIVSVDPVKGALTVDRGRVSEGTPQQTVLLMNKETAISKAGVSLQAADLRPGDERVTIQYVTQGSQPPVARASTFEKPDGLVRAAHHPGHVHG